MDNVSPGNHWNNYLPHINQERNEWIAPFENSIPENRARTHSDVVFGKPSSPLGVPHHSGGEIRPRNSK